MKYPYLTFSFSMSIRLGGDVRHLGARRIDLGAKPAPMLHHEAPLIERLIIKIGPDLRAIRGTTNALLGSSLLPIDQIYRVLVVGPGPGPYRRPAPVRMYLELRPHAVEYPFERRSTVNASQLAMLVGSR
jgi:hypothetical protein